MSERKADLAVPGPSIKRRTFLKVLGAAGVTATGLTGSAASGSSGARGAEDPCAVLIDTTRCLGCRSCEYACAEANGLPEPAGGDEVFEKERPTSEAQLTVVNRYETGQGEVFAKKQCMHCVVPACASACLTKAMLKTEEGPVVWRVGKCMGCRFCMISCPFDAPKFEYDSATPEIRKCRLCRERTLEGRMPACVENCPGEALAFGKRSEMLAEARRRIQESPDRYVPHIYGEHEVGGTSALYLSSVPFNQIGFRTDLGTVAYPELTKNFLYAVPFAFTMVPAFLLAVSKAVEPEGEDGETDDQAA